MNKKLYDIMDWAGIEGIVYSEEDHPEKLLGPHHTEAGVVIQAFFPGAKQAAVQVGKTLHPMELADEAGYFAVLLERKTIPQYTYQVTYEAGKIENLDDPYAYPAQLSEKEMKKFGAGIHYEIYEKLGAHPMTVNGTEGVYFAVWAPNAVRVSVVGQFNMWDGRRLPMRRFGDSGVFELFVPGLKTGTVYKYEIKAKSGMTFLKADPYAFASELRPATASVVADLSQFTWTDEKWMEQRSVRSTKDQPMAVYELHPGTFRQPEDGREYYTYRELAPMVAAYVKEMGYTHIELLPIMEHMDDKTWGYQVTGYYAPTARYGTPEEFMYFMNYMHEQGIGVILDWVPSNFPRDIHGLCGFDGTCLYEHKDPRQHTHGQFNTLLYNFSRPEVCNFLIANALFWKKKYHADGLRLNAVASMLYLNYAKNDGEWVANIYGSYENLEAIEFLKQLNSVYKKENDGSILIAEDSSSWPKLTDSIDKGGLGFDYKWNVGWAGDFLGYLQLDPSFRSHHHGELTLSMLYHYSEDYILPLSHDEMVYGKGSMISKVPGKKKNKFANLRAAYGYMMMHPGKKLIFMGQEFAQTGEWNGSKGLNWSIPEEEENGQLQKYVKALLSFYKSQPALFEKDYDPKGFEWINHMAASENLLTFMRKGNDPGEELLVVVNFSPLTYEKHKVGVPYAGKFKEIFNSDSTVFGGNGNVNPRVKASKKVVCDDREHSIEILIPPMGIAVFKCTRTEEKTKTEKK